jgi:hypothetical protein
MGVVPTNPARSAANDGSEPQTFWQRIVQSLDQLVINRSRQAVPAIALRRSKYEFARCRHLLYDTTHARP